MSLQLHYFKKQNFTKIFNTKNSMEKQNILKVGKKF